MSGTEGAPQPRHEQQAAGALGCALDLSLEDLEPPAVGEGALATMLQVSDGSRAR